MAKYYEKIFPSNLEECLKLHGEIPPGLFCNATWDTVLCWPPALRGSKIKLPCPKNLGLGPDIFAVKSCGVDGRWVGKNPGEYMSWEPGWTNYSQCKGLVYERPENISGSDLNASVSAPISLGALQTSFNGADILACVMLSLSAIFTIASIGISCSSKGIQPIRTRIFRNLFAAFLFHDLLELCINISRTMENSRIINDVETCVAIGVLITLTSSAIYAWIVIVGVYYVMCMKEIVIERKMYYVLCLLGWFVPTVVTITWLSVTVLGGNLHCWYATLYIAEMHSSVWIIEVTNILFIVLTWCLLVHFLRKYDGYKINRQNSDNKELIVELGHIKQSSYKVLIVLSFVTFAYIIYMLYAFFTDASISALGYMYVLIVYARGIVGPIFLCFLDDSCSCWEGIYAVETSDLDEESENSA